MTKIKVFSVLFSAFVLLCSANLSSKLFLKTSSLEVKGYVFENNKKVQMASVKLYQNNKVVKMTSTKKGKFQFILFSGIRYMVEVNKSDCITERIQISTIERTEFGGKYLYEFRVDLVGKDKYKGADISNLDFPTALIKYDKEEGEYMHDQTYSRQVKADLKKIKEAASK